MVGHHVDQPDEGVRKIAHHLASVLASRHEVVRVGITSFAAWRQVKGFRPDVIHYVLSPTLAGLAAAKVLSLTCRSAASVVSAPHPDFRSLGRLASLFRPDLVLVQAEDSERTFSSWGFRTRFLPNGVDTQRCSPIDGPDKMRLRQKYGIAEDRFVVLHVGPVTQQRNLQSIQQLQRDDTQVLVVGRPSQPGDQRLIGDLRKRRCQVWTQYIPHVEEIYGLSDCYVFPTTDRRQCVEMPLSVLEAMSCNLPVVTTRFGALPRVFDEGQGLVFADDHAGLKRGLESAKEGVATGTRDMVLPYAWDRVVTSLERVYTDLLRGGSTVPQGDSLLPAQNRRQK